MDPYQTFKIPPNVIARTVGAEVVILDVEGGTYFGLDPWERGYGNFLQRADRSLRSETPCSPNSKFLSDVLEEDLRRLVDDLQQKKLISDV